MVAQSADYSKLCLELTTISSGLELGFVKLQQTELFHEAFALAAFPPNCFPRSPRTRGRRSSASCDVPCAGESLVCAGEVPGLLLDSA